MGNRRLSLDTALSRPVCTTRQIRRPAGETTASSIPSLTALPVCPKAKAVRLSSFVSSLGKRWLRRTVTNWLSGQEKTMPRWLYFSVRIPSSVELSLLSVTSGTQHPFSVSLETQREDSKLTCTKLSTTACLLLFLLGLTVWRRR